MCELENLSIVVLNYNSSADTIKCVNQLLSFSMGFHVVIVDNDSSDDSYRILLTTFQAEKSVDVISAGTNGGYSCGNNVGIRYADKKFGSDTLAIINPDVIIPEKEILSSLHDLLWRYADCAFVGAKPMPGEGYLQKKYKGAWQLPTALGAVLGHSLLSSQNKAVYGEQIELGKYQVDCLAGCFFLAKKELFESIGYFDENVFLYNEENIIGAKCKRDSLKLIIDTNQVYFHNHDVINYDGLTISKRMADSKIVYESRKYFIMQYYQKSLLPLLGLVELGNKIIQVGGFLKHSLIFRDAKSVK